MNNTTVLIVSAFVLGAGTFGFRVAGPVLRTRMDLSPRTETLMTRLAVVLLVALVATTATLDGGTFAGFARPVGVLVGGVLAWRKAPFVVVVIAAALTAAGLRLLGVP